MAFQGQRLNPTEQPWDTTNYIHPSDPNLADLHTAMEYDADGKPVLRTKTNIDGDITITGSVTIPSEVTVVNSHDNPLHTETHLLDENDVEYSAANPLTIDGTVTVNQPVAVTDNNGSLTVDGTVNIGTMPEVEIKNDAGNPIPISGTVTTIGGSSQGKLWTFQVAQGLIAGHSAVQVTGYNPATSANDAVWAGGTAYPWSAWATPQTLYLKSSTNNATDRGMPFLVVGLDADFNPQSETVTLNASDSRTAVATVHQYKRLHYIMCDAGDNNNAGDITATITSGSGTLVNKLLSGYGIAKSGVYTVPAGYTGYLWKGDASSSASTVVNFMVRYYDKPFLVAHIAIVDNGTYIYDFPFPQVLPEKTDMYCVVDSGSGKTAINFEILLVAN